MKTMTESFIITKEYKRFQEFCEACKRDRYIGICYGPAGVGKTLSARKYTQWDIFDEFNKQKPEERIGKVPSSFKTADSILYTARVTNAPSKTARSLGSLTTSLFMLSYDAGISENFNENDYDKRSYVGDRLDAFMEDRRGFHREIDLIIIDEADRLNFPALEQLRDIYDEGKSGLVLIGMPGIEKKLSRYPQLYSRVGFAHEFRPLNSQELLFIMEHYFSELDIGLDPKDFADHETITAIVNTTRGNFRLFKRLFTQIKRIMHVNNTKVVTREIVQAARDCLVIGL